MTSGSARFARALRRQGMPSDEIRAMLSATDPELVRRYAELHGERLKERLAAHKRTLLRIERSLTRAMPDQIRRR